MEKIETRITKAQELWAEGERLESAHEYHKAYELYTQAHDLVVDCAKFHQIAHERLRRVNLKIGNWGELMTDWALHVFAPFKVFEIVSYFSKSDGYISTLCRRNA